MPKKLEDISINVIHEFLEYDSEKGIVFWKVSPAKNVYAGEIAGCVKTLRTNKKGEKVSYSYIRIAGENIPTSRVVWALVYNEWPKGRVSFLDGNPLNLNVDNLSLKKSLGGILKQGSAEIETVYYKEHRRVNRVDYADKHLQRKYGITIADYSQMFLKQNGKCAICGGEDGGTRHGNPKALAVDHDHKTGMVRGLLCEACNQGIGKLKEDVEILQNAIRYLTTT